MPLGSRSDTLNAFHAHAMQEGIPSADIERWITATARPCATLSLHEDGPVVGRFGGPFAVPAGEPDPPAPLLASIDCAALPKDTTDLPLPTDGQLLFFGFPGDDGPLAKVVYAPAGAVLEERQEDRWFWEDEDQREFREQYSEGDLHLTFDISLPGQPLPGHPLARELARTWIWRPVEPRHGGILQIGGYSHDDFGGDWAPHLAGAADDPDDWTLLADWHSDFYHREGYVIHWGIRRRDLAARHFDEVKNEFFWNP